MKIYLASSLKNQIACRRLGELIREKFGHDVYVFCDETAPAFAVTKEFQKNPAYKTLNAETALMHPLTHKIYVEDGMHLKSCDCVLLMLPCGKNAHMEAGIAKGMGKKVVVFGPVVTGDWDTTYLAFDAFFSTDNNGTERMLKWFEERSPKKNDSHDSEKQPVTETATERG